MLTISLFLSLILLLVANWAIRRSRRPLAAVLLTAMVLSFGPCFIFLILPALMWHALSLTIAVGVAHWRGWRPATFTRVSLGVTLAAYGVVSGFAWHDLNRLQARYPYVSMEERLPFGGLHAKALLPEGNSQRLLDLEAGLENASRQWPGERRQHSLKRLHEQTLQVFVSQPGFGQTRMSGMWELRGRQRNSPPPAQPGSSIPFVWSTGDLEGPAPALSDADLTQSWKMHTEGLLDFLNPSGFGYFKDRRHVAGFQEHRFSEEPVAEKPWKLQTLELVGLVVHAQPVVYVSDHLPSMEELSKTAQRSLDSFEMVGLQALGNGEDLYVRDASHSRRMLGAIRSVKQCLDCHGGARGDLLGAFSYTLSRTP